MLGLNNDPTITALSYTDVRLTGMYKTEDKKTNNNNRNSSCEIEDFWSKLKSLQPVRE